MSRCFRDSASHNWFKICTLEASVVRILLVWDALKESGFSEVLIFSIIMISFAPTLQMLPLWWKCKFCKSLNFIFFLILTAYLVKSSQRYPCHSLNSGLVCIPSTSFVPLISVSWKVLDTGKSKIILCQNQVLFSFLIILIPMWNLRELTFIYDIPNIWSSEFFPVSFIKLNL